MNKNVLIVALLIMLNGCATTHPNTSYDVALHEHPDQFLVLAVSNDVDTSTHIGSASRGYDAAAAYVQSARARQLLQHIASDYQLQSVRGWPIQALAMQCVVFKPINNIATAELITQLQRDPRVMLAEPLQTFSTNTTAKPGETHPPASHVPPSDNYASLQLGMQRMEVADAHHWSTGRGIEIAVIDTGMDSTHPDLKNRVSEQRNFVDDNKPQFNMDRHGTAIAGVIAANSDGRAGITGVAPEAKLIALKACWQVQADRDDARCNSFTLAQALASAIEMHVQVINLSLVGPSDLLLSALIKQAQNAGIIVVGAADGDGRATFPAHLPNVIAVNAMEQQASSSSILNAPGRDVLTLMPGGRYDFSSGNSIATAEISGTVALLLASHANHIKLDSMSVQKLLLQSSETSNVDKLSSVNACHALSRLLNQPGCNRSPISARN